MEESEGARRWTEHRVLVAWRGHVSRVLDAYRAGEQRALPWWERALALPAQLIILTVRELFRDGVLTLASSLAFFSVLSIVPLLSVATALLGAFGVFESSGADLARYLGALFPTSGYEIVTYLRKFSVQGAASIGGISGLSLLVIGVTLFNSIERALSNIWHGVGERNIIQKFLMFYTMITLGPVLLIMSIIQSAKVQLFISGFGVDTSSVSLFLPFMYALVVFTLMNKILPNTSVDWASALVGGAVTAAAFELAKWGFNQYVNLIVFDSYNKLYGALGLAPIFMIWVYVTWLVILIGSEMAYCYQHMGNLLRTEAPLETLWRGGGSSRVMVEPVMSVEVFSPIAQSYHDGAGALSEVHVQRMTGYPGEVVREIVDRLIQDEVIMVVGKGKGASRALAPARPLDQIELERIVRSFFLRRPALGGEVDALVAEVERQTARVFEGLDARDVLREADEPPA